MKRNVLSVLLLGSFAAWADEPATPQVYVVEARAATEPPTFTRDVPDGSLTATGLVLTINSTRRFQTMAGVGAAFNEIGGEALTHLPAEQQRRLMATLFDPSAGAGLAIGRVPVGASDFALSAYSLNETAGDYAMEHFTLERDERFLLPFIRAALAIHPALRLHACPWSPPGWLKTNGRMTDGGQLLDSPDAYRAYARYLRLFVEGYAQRGVVIDRLFVQNEPNVAMKYPTCLMPPAQMATFVVDYLAPEFGTNHTRAAIWAGTFQEKRDLYAHECLARPGFADAIQGLGFQYSDLKNVRDAQALAPRLPVMHTESACFDGANNAGQARALFDDALDHFNAGCTAYTYWNMILNETQRSTWDWKQNSLVTIDRDAGRVFYQPDFLVLFLISRAVQPGSTWVEAFATPAPRAAAFANTDGSITALVWNDGERTTCRIQVDARTYHAELPARAPCAIRLPPAPAGQTMPRDLRLAM